jgi:hypothetical protein
MRAGLSILILIVGLPGCERQAPSPPGDQDILFAQKAFFDGRKAGLDIVHAAGALTGPGVGYPNNCTAISCYLDRMECVVSTIEQIGGNQMGRIDMPDFFSVKQWNNDVIVAGGPYDLLHCRWLTITIARTSETALWANEPTNESSHDCQQADKKSYKWSIEDPPSRKAFDTRTRG